MTRVVYVLDMAKTMRMGNSLAIILTSTVSLG